MFRIFMRRWITDRQTRRRDQYAALLAIVGLLCALLTLTFMILSQFPGRFGAVGLGGVILFAAAAAGGGLGFLFRSHASFLPERPARMAPIGRRVRGRRSRLIGFSGPIPTLNGFPNG